MATVVGSGVWTARRCHKVTWTPITTTNAVTDAYSAQRLQDKVVQCFGTFGAAATVTIQGSNDGGTTWSALRKADNTAATFTTAGGNDIFRLQENPQLIRASLGGGDGTTSLTVIITSTERPK